MFLTLLKELSVVEFDPSAISGSRARLAGGSREHMSADQTSVLTGSQYLRPPSAPLSTSSQSHSFLQLPPPMGALQENGAIDSASNSPAKRRRLPLSQRDSSEHVDRPLLSAADIDREQLFQQQLLHQHMMSPEHFAQRPVEKRAVRVLDCDSISQVKRKICSALYEHVAFSSRPPSDSHELGMCFFVFFSKEIFSSLR